jgi:hypothetical protein
MAFQPLNTALFSSNEQTILNFLTGQLMPPQIWSYKTEDTIATVTTADYFKGIGPNQFNVALNQLRIGDLVWASCGNGNIMLQVTALTPDVTLTQYEAVPAGSISNADVAADAAIAFSKLAALTSARILVGSAGNVATAVAMSGDVAISNTGATTIQPGAIDLAMLSAGVTPSHVIKFAGQPTTVGGAAAEAFAIPGVLVTDLAFVQVVNDGTGNVTVLQAACTADTLTVTFSANPGNDTVINYQIIRAAA